MWKKVVLVSLPSRTKHYFVLTYQKAAFKKELCFCFCCLKINLYHYKPSLCPLQQTGDSLLERGTYVVTLCSGGINSQIIDNH